MTKRPLANLKEHTLTASSSAVESLPLILKFRPKAFDEVIGNQFVIKALVEAVRSQSRPHSYLFVGPSGLGKTTLARIIASETNSTTMEIDAASHSGVDEMKHLVEMAGIKPLMGSVVYIIDECHTITKQGWQALLKLTEDPPRWLTIALCTTEDQKVPETIKTRCYQVRLKALRPQEIEEYLSTIAQLENWTVNNDVMQNIVQAAEGSPRRGLTLLQAGHAATSRDELAQIISSVDAEVTVLELVNLLVDGNKSWERISKLFTKIDDYDEAVPAAVRLLTNNMFRAESEKQAGHIWSILEALTSQNGWDAKAKLACLVGRMLWS